MTETQPALIAPGDVVWTWCGKCMERTDHQFRPGTTKPLTCLDCEKEAEKEPTP